MTPRRHGRCCFVAVTLTHTCVRMVLSSFFTSFAASLLHHSVCQSMLPPLSRAVHAPADISSDEQRIVACGFDKTFKILETDSSLLEALQE